MQLFFCTNINIFVQMQIYLCAQVTVCWERTGEGGTTEDITVTIARRPGRGLGLSVVGRRDGPGQLPLVTTSNTGLLLVQVRTHDLILVCYWCRSLHLGPGAGGRGGGGGQPAPRGPDHQGQWQGPHKLYTGQLSVDHHWWIVRNAHLHLNILDFNQFSESLSLKNHYFFQDAAVACLKTAVGDIKMVVRRLKILTK